LRVFDAKGFLTKAVIKVFCGIAGLAAKFGGIRVEKTGAEDFLLRLAANVPEERLEEILQNFEAIFETPASGVDVIWRRERSEGSGEEGSGENMSFCFVKSIEFDDSDKALFVAAGK